MEPKPFNMNQLDNFKNWLIAKGAEILRVTSEYEILRFKTNRPGVSIIYFNKYKVCTLTGESEVAWTAFCSNISWTAGNTNVKRRKCKSSVLYQTLKERDGDVCFYCGLALNRDFISIEHLLSINHGGSNHQFFREKPGPSGRGGIAAHPQGCGFFAMDLHRLTKFTENTIICK